MVLEFVIEERFQIDCECKRRNELREDERGYCKIDKTLPQEWDIGVENPSYMISVLSFV